MRLYIILILSFLQIGCLEDSLNSNNVVQNDFEGFQQFLGDEKAKADKILVAAFDQFLIDNFPNEKNQNERTKRLLEFFKDGNHLENRNWDVSSIPDKKMIQRLEEFGLRKEIWLYAYEDYHTKHQFEDSFTEEIESVTNLGELILPDDIPIEPENTNDTTKNLQEFSMENNPQIELVNCFRINYEGEYFYGLAQFSKMDKNIQEYIQAIRKAGDMSPSITAPAFLQKFKNFEEPFVKRIVMLEYFWPICKSIETL